MGSIGWYIFRTTLGAFLLIVISLTAVIWLATALRDLDLMTSQGQTLLVFIGIGALSVYGIVGRIADCRARCKRPGKRAGGAALSELALLCGL